MAKSTPKKVVRKKKISKDGKKCNMACPKSGCSSKCNDNDGHQGAHGGPCGHTWY